MKLTIDVAALTFDDHVDVENETGADAIQAVWAFMKGRATPRQLRAMVWVFGRKLDSTFTLEDAGSIPVSDVEFVLPETQDDGEAEGGD